MIVKNESRVIRRCLSSLVQLIDDWVIVDTGSTDGTQEMICRYLAHIPGRLYERAWVDFAWNRNEALKLGSTLADYFLFIDADDQLIGSFDKEKLGLDFYAVNYQKGPCTTKRILLARQGLDWKWEGIIHETLSSERAKSSAFLSDVWIQAGKEGSRARDPNTLKKDIELLKKVLAKGEDKARLLFHLGVFSEEAKDLTFALECFEKRALMGGWDQEVFYALFRIGALQEMLGASFETVEKSYLKAFSHRPSRAEPLVALGVAYLQKKAYEKAYFTLEKALSIPLSSDVIYVMQNIYEYGALFYFAEATFRLGRYEKTWDLYKKLLAIPNLLPSEREYLEKNRAQIAAHLALRSKKSFSEFLLKSPFVASELDIQRDKGSGRKIDL